MVGGLCHVARNRLCLGNREQGVLTADLWLMGCIIAGTETTPQFDLGCFHAPIQSKLACYS
jgi:hypothetical protein